MRSLQLALRIRQLNVADQNTQLASEEVARGAFFLGLATDTLGRVLDSARPPVPATDWTYERDSDLEEFVIDLNRTGHAKPFVRWCGLTSMALQSWARALDLIDGSAPEAITQQIENLIVRTNLISAQNAVAFTSQKQWLRSFFNASVYRGCVEPLYQEGFIPASEIAMVAANFERSQLPPSPDAAPALVNAALTSCSFGDQLAAEARGQDSFAHFVIAIHHLSPYYHQANSLILWACDRYRLAGKSIPREWEIEAAVIEEKRVATLDVLGSCAQYLMTPIGLFRRAQQMRWDELASRLSGVIDHSRSQTPFMSDKIESAWRAASTNGNSGAMVSSSEFDALVIDHLRKSYSDGWALDVARNVADQWFHHDRLWYLNWDWKRAWLDPRRPIVKRTVKAKQKRVRPGWTTAQLRTFPEPRFGTAGFPDDLSSHARDSEILRSQLRWARDKGGLTRKALAERLHTSSDVIAELEQGQRSPDYLDVANWCLAVGVPFNEFAASVEANRPGRHSLVRALNTRPTEKPRRGSEQSIAIATPPSAPKKRATYDEEDLGPGVFGPMRGCRLELGPPLDDREVQWVFENVSRRAPELCDYEFTRDTRLHMLSTGCGGQEPLTPDEMYIKVVDSSLTFAWGATSHRTVSRVLAALLSARALSIRPMRLTSFDHSWTFHCQVPGNPVAVLMGVLSGEETLLPFCNALRQTTAFELTNSNCSLSARLDQHRVLGMSVKLAGEHTLRPWCGIQVDDPRIRSPRALRRIILDHVQAVGALLEETFLPFIVRPLADLSIRR